MKGSEEKVRILQLKELKRPIWQEKMQHSVKQAQKEEDGEACAEAQGTLINLIMCLGGIREDVFEYLMFPRFSNVEAVRAIGNLLCYAAPVEWIELSVRALERIAGIMYVNEIIESYQAGISVKQVECFLEESETVFEMCQHRLDFTNKQLGDRVTGSEEEKPADRVTGSGNAIEGGGMAYGNLAQIITDAVMAAMQKSGQMIIAHTKMEPADRMTGSEEELGDKVTGSKGEKPTDRVTGSWREEPADRVTGSEEELPDRVTGSKGEKPTDRVTGSWEEKPEDKMTGSEEEKLTEKETGQEVMQEFAPEEIPDFPDGEELQDNRILVKELKEAEEQAGKRISFFQILLSRHMKKAFAKLDAEAQVSKIFEIMVEKKYGKEKILPIRRLMNGGMSNEFIFSLLEKDFSEEELNELCDTLLAEDITLTGKKVEMSKSQEAEDEEELAEWEEEE